MNYSALCEWLIKEKNMSRRSAKDVISRCKRVEKMTETDEIQPDSLEKLVAIDSYNHSSVFIKSQLKRAIALASEFMEVK